MSEEQLKAFLSKAKGDSNLQEKLKAAKSPEDVVGIAKEHGHEFTPDKLDQMSGKVLESVSGGTVRPWLEECRCMFWLKLLQQRSLLVGPEIKMCFLFEVPDQIRNLKPLH